VISDSDVFTVTVPGSGSQNFIDAQANTGATTLTGHADAGDTGTVSVDGGPGQPATMAADGSGNWTFQLEGLTDGTSYTAVATATDVVGDTAASAPYSFTIDAPPISISRISDPATRVFLGGNYIDLPYGTTSFTTTLTGKATPGDLVTLSVNGGAPQVTSMADDGSWTFTLSGNGHVYTIVATATDSAGDTAVSSPFTLTTDWLRSYYVRSLLSYQSSFDQFAGGFNVGDTADHIGAAFDQLADSHIVWIKISDNAAVTLTARQVVSDAEAIGKLQNADGSPPGIAITDTAANVAANLDTLQALADQRELASITLTDGGTPTLTITASQLAIDALALADITSPFDLAVTGVAAANAAAVDGSVIGNGRVTSVAVLDTAADVAANLDTLQALGVSLASITLADPVPPTPTLTITTAQLASDAGALEAITSPFDLAVTGVAAANAATVEGTVVGNGTVTSVAVFDTAANVATNLDALQALAAAGELAAITLTDALPPTLTLSYSQLLTDARALSDIVSLYSISVPDVPAANALRAGLFPGVSSVAVSDTAADVALNLDTLQALADQRELASITLTDEGTPTLFITAAQLANDGAALADIASPYTLDGTPPVITILSGVANGEVTSATELSVSAMVTDADLAAVSVNGVTAALAADGSYSASVPLPSTEGPYTVQVVAIDLAGNSSSATEHTTIDHTPPAITISGVTDGEVTSATVMPVFSATDANLATVSATLDGQPFASGAAVDAEGAHTLMVTAPDLAGNTSTATEHFTIDRTPPVLTPVANQMLEASGPAGVVVTLRRRRPTCWMAPIRWCSRKATRWSSRAKPSAWAHTRSRRARRTKPATPRRSSSTLALWTPRRRM
jgi:hypothetical protein